MKLLRFDQRFNFRHSQSIRNRLFLFASVIFGVYKYINVTLLCICVIVVVRVDDKPIRLQLCDTAGQVSYSALSSS